MREELEKAAEEYSINGDYQFMSTFQQMAQKAFIAGANWQASNTIITDNSLVIDNKDFGLHGNPYSPIYPCPEVGNVITTANGTFNTTASSTTIEEKEITTLLNNYDKYSHMIVEEFLKKHDFVEDDNVMEFNRISNTDWSVIEISDYFLNISDIIYDLRNDIDKDKFFDWYDYALEWSCDGYPHVNYNSYLMGFRHKKRNKWQEFVYKSKNKLLSVYYYLKYRKDWKILKEKFKKEFDKINK